MQRIQTQLYISTIRITAARVSVIILINYPINANYTHVGQTLCASSNNSAICARSRLERVRRRVLDVLLTKCSRVFDDLIKGHAYLTVGLGGNNCQFNYVLQHSCIIIHTHTRTHAHTHTRTHTHTHARTHTHTHTHMLVFMVYGDSP